MNCVCAVVEPRAVPHRVDTSLAHATGTAPACAFYSIFPSWSACHVALIRHRMRHRHQQAAYQPPRPKSHAQRTSSTLGAKTPMERCARPSAPAQRRPRPPSTACGGHVVPLTFRGSAAHRYHITRSAALPAGCASTAGSSCGFAPQHSGTDYTIRSIRYDGRQREREPSGRQQLTCEKENE